MHNRYDHEKVAKRIRELSNRINSLGLLSKPKAQEKAYARCDFDDDLDDDDLDNELESVAYKPRRTTR